MTHETDIEPLPECPDCHDAVVELDVHSRDCADRARRLVAEDQHRRETECLQALQAVLDRYGMQLSVSPASIVLGPKGS